MFFFKIFIVIIGVLGGDYGDVGLKVVNFSLGFVWKYE